MSRAPAVFTDTDVHAFVDGQMDIARRAAFVQAMSADADLRAEVENWRRQNEALTAAFQNVLNEPVPARLMPTTLNSSWRVAAGRPQPEAPPEPRPAAGHVLVVALSAALSFALGGCLVFGLDAAGVLPASILHHAGPPASFVQPRGLAQRAYEAHETYATDLNHPVEIGGADASHLLRWIQHRLSMPIRIPDLRRDGWTLMGGRVLPGDYGPAAFLLYGNGVDRIGLYIARTNSRQTDDTAIYDNGAGLATVAYWVDEPVGYALTTTRDGAWLAANAPPLVKSIRVQASDNAAAQ